MERDLRIVPTDTVEIIEIYSRQGGAPPMTLPFLDDLLGDFLKSGDRPELVRGSVLLEERILFQ